MNVFDDLLSQKEASAIHSYLMGSHFPWFYTSDDPSTKYEHIFYAAKGENPEPDREITAGTALILDPLMAALKVSKPFVVKAVSLAKTGDIIQQEYTSFRSDPGSASNSRKVAIYYVNSNNGILEIADSNTSYSPENLKIESLANSLVVLEEGIKYKGSTCTDKERRVFIRVEYEEQPYKMIRVDK
tara:strand:- start:19 stop:576 length:558 start_codon:yes stop_codon:yes gene_type:complete